MDDPYPDGDASYNLAFPGAQLIAGFTLLKDGVAKFYRIKAQ